MSDCSPKTYAPRAEREILSLSDDLREAFLAENRRHRAWRILQQLDERSWLVQSTKAFSSLFCQHRFPVQWDGVLRSLSSDSLERLPWGLIQAELSVPEATPFSVQISANQRLEVPFSEVAEVFARGLGLDLSYQSLRKPEWVVSVFAHRTPSSTHFFLGASPTVENVSPWAGGQCRIPRLPESISRAESKLLEAMEAFDLRDQLSYSGRVLDLGAAPGGWSRILAGMGQQVDAVDPADLHPSLLNDPRVSHHRQTAAQFLRTHAATYDLVVCDMKMEPSMVADLLVRNQQALKPGGLLLLTFKLCRGAKAYGLAKDALARLRTAFELLKARQLYFNRREITVLARRAQGAQG